MLRELGIFIITTYRFNYERKPKLSDCCNLRRLDGDTSLLLVLPGVSGPGLTGFGAGNDTSLGQKGVGQCGLAVVDVSNNTHVTNVMLFVHDPTDLVHGEIDLGNKGIHYFAVSTCCYLLCILASTSDGRKFTA